MRCLPTLTALLLACCSLVPLPAAAKGPATQIAYVHGHELIGVTPDGSHRWVIGRVPRGVVDLAASADGRLFALLANRPVRVGERGSDRSLYLLRPGRGLRLLDSWHDLGPRSVALSQSGDELAFVRGGEIWSRRVGSGRAVRVTSAPGSAAAPAFFADGEELVFERTGMGQPGLYRAPLRGGRPEAQLVAGDFSEPAVSAKGSVAFRAEDRSTDEVHLGLIRAGGVRPRFIGRSEDPFQDGGPSFSPSSSHLAFFSQREGPRRLRYSLETVNLDGSNRRAIIGDIGAGSIGPVWTAMPRARG